MRTRRPFAPRPLSTSLSGLSSALAIAAAVVSATSAHGANISWDGEGADSLWLTPTNWFDSTNLLNDVAPLATDDLTFGLGGATTVNLGGNQTANSITFSLAGFTLGTAATVNQLAVTSGNIAVNTGIAGTINAILTTPGALTKTGDGTLTLTAASTRTGTTAVNAGRLAVTNLTAVGNGAVTISGVGSTYEINTAAGTSAQAITVDNGGTFQWTQNAQLTLGPALSVTGTGGTVFVGGTGSSGKVLANAGLVSSAAGSLLTKTGGGVLQLSGANSGFLGDLSIQAGTVEFQNVDSLGTTAKTVTIGGTGDFATGGAANRNNIILNAGGTISANNAAADYTGTINVAANATAALRQFQTVGNATSFRISGALTGSGNLAVTAPAAATLTLAGSRAAHTGQVVAGNNATVLYSNASTINTTSGIGLAGGTAQIRAINSAAPVLGTPGLNATYYNFGTNPGIAANNFAVDNLYLAPRAFSRTDANVNLINSGSGDWATIPIPGYGVGVGAGGQQDGVMWKGLINITNAATYQFSGTSDDNYVLFIDGVQIGTLGVIATNTNIGGGVVLSAGPHSIVVKHTQGGGGGYATLSYNGGAGSDAPSTVIVPASAFTNGSLAPIDLGPVNVSGGTLDIVSNATTSNLTLGNGTFTLASPTIDNLTAAGGIIIAATPTLAPTSAGLIVTGAIGQDVAGRGLNFAGPYFAEFQGTNTYTGTTTVTGGQLRLNATGGNSIAGNLTLNAPNGTGAINNVVLRQGDQIADTATVTMTQGILDFGANSDTIANLAMNGGVISGTTGVLTVTNAPTLTAGTIGVGLAGNFTLNKTGAGTAVLSGNNTYTGVTNVTSGILQAQSTNALGAGGAGNGTTVASGASLRTNGANISAENVSIAGLGIAGDASEAALRNLSGVSQINGLTTTADSTVRVDTGELIINGPLDVTAGVLTKTGNGTLTFATNQASIPSVTFLAGALGFKGPQSFGAATVPAGLAYQFDSDPTAGVSITAPAGTTVIGNYSIDQAFLSRITAASAGALAITADNSNNLNFAANAGLSLGAKGLVNYTGTLTPGAGGYRLGGGGGALTVFSTLSGTNDLQVNGEVQLNAVNTFTGGITVTAGSRLHFLNNDGLGNAANVVTLDGGTLQIDNVGDVTGGTGTWAQLGNPAPGGRVISVASGGGTIHIPARQAQGNFATITTTNGLTGSGALTKTGLGFLEVLTTNSYNGALTIGVNGNRVDLRASGALPNVASITINNNGRLDVDNNATLGSTRQFPFVDTRDRINDAAPINLNGGTLRFVGRNVAFAAGAPATSQENFGVTTLGIGQSFINSTRTGGGGADLVISNLVRTVGGGTVNFTTDGNTLGQFGDNPRIILSQINGAAPAFSSFIGGWATINSGDFAAYGQNATVGGVTATSTGVVNYGSTGAPTYTALTSTAVPAAGGFVSGSIGSAAADVTLGVAGPGQDFTVGALRLAGAATRQILFAGTTGTPDTLYVESGGIISENVNNARNIGVNTNVFTRGRLTAGAVGATTAQELFIHNNQNTFTINSQIIDNPGGGTVKLVKTQDGTVTLDGTNLFSGGTLVQRGTLTVNSTGGLGTGAVTVTNATLNLGNKAATSSVDGITLADQSVLVLTNNTAGAAGTYDGAGDRFTIPAGSTIFGNSPGANFGLNSLTRVSTLTGPGQVVLAPGAIVKHNLTNAANQGTGALTIKNLGTNADLFFAPVSAAPAFNQSITIGAGTPWAGLSSDRGNTTWASGTIFANSDFVLQGLTSNGAVSTFILGVNTTAANSQGGIQIVNNTGGAINATVVGAVAINEDEPVLMPSNLTFVLTSGSIFQPNTSMAMGFGASQAKILVRAGATLDPGNYTASGATANTNKNLDGTLNGTQNLPYALPSPVNGLTTVEAGGRFLINDASGIGSAPVGSYTLKKDSILQLGTTNAFFGRGTYGLTQTGPVDTTGVALPGQFVYESGVIVRLNADNVYKLSQFVAPTAIYELYDGNRTLTNQNNTFIIPVVGTPTIAPEAIAINSGGMLTNDVNDRTVNEGRGRIILGDGAVLSATTGTYFTITEGFNIDAGANVTVGANRYLDGLPKLGAVQFNGANSNTAGAGATFTVIDGAQLSFNAVNVFPNDAAINLAAPVVAFPGPGGSATQPSTGSTLLLNTNNFMEYTGHVTGNGTVMANTGGTALAINATSDFSSNIVFKNTNGQQPSLMKAGPATLTLTGNSDSQGVLLSQQGSLVISNGTADWNELRPQRGSSIVVDNSVNATNNRLGLPAFFVGQGGTFELKGNATTPVRESFNALASGAGNFIGQAQNSMISTLKVSAGAASTTLQFLSIENYVSAGQRLAAYVINSPTVANGPMTYSTASAIVPNAGNLGNGLVEVAAPNFGFNGATGLGSGIVFGGSGTPVMPIRNDLLGDANGDGIAEGLVTQDGVNFATGNTSGTNLITGIPNTSGLAAGMLVTGAGIPAGTRIDTIVGPTSVTLTNNTTAAATNLNVIVGGLRNLAASEYASSFRDNQSTGLNVKVSGTANIAGDTRVQTVTFAPGSTLNINGTLPLNATSSRLLLNSSAIFVQPGGAATINGSTSGGTESYIQFIGGSGVFLHTWGDLNLNTKVHSDVGIVKTGPGTLNFGPGAFTGFRGSFQLDGGTVNLGAGNRVQNIRSQGGSTGTNFYVNAGTLNLNGNSQMVNLLNSASELSGMGGTVTSATPATITNVGGGRFAGNLDGAISLDKAGNNTLLLTSPQTYTGTTTVRAGTLTLRDSAKLAAGAGLISIRNATLQLDNGYLSSVVNRIDPATPVEMSGGTFNITGGAGQLVSQTLNSLTLVGGTNSFTNNAGGSGANELFIGNLSRTQGPNGSGASLNIVQNFGFVGTAGTDTTAIRDFITNVNGTSLALNDGIIGGWAIVNGNDFATYQAATGIGAYGNLNDGYAAYESTNALTATATQNVNDGAARIFAANATINSWRIAPNAAVTMTVNASVGLTIDSGGLLTNNNNSTTFASGGAGSFITSNSGELNVFVNQNTTIINVPITGDIDLVKAGGGSLTLGAANTYTGTTFATGGLNLTLSLAGANGTTAVSVPGRLVIDATTVTETVANQLSTNTDIVVGGGGRFNLMNAAGITESIRSVTFLDGSSGTATSNGLDRTASQLTSTINLSGPVAITSTNTNPVTGVPFIGGFAGTVGFTNAAGSTLNINSATDASGVLSVGLRFGSRIGNVPTGIAEGGLIKTGNGLLTLDPDQNPTFPAGTTVVGSAVITGLSSTAGLAPGQQITGTGIPAGAYVISVDTATAITISALATAAGSTGTITGQPYNFLNFGTTAGEALNVTSGVVRADRHGSLGSPYAVTTVQSGAVLLGANSVGQIIAGSVTLKSGSTLGATINGFTIGAATDSVANQTVVRIPDGSVNIATYDYYIPSTNSGNITINGKLTGSGNINLVGQQLTQGSGGGGLFQLGNPIVSGAGSNDYSGTINVGTNAILANQIALIPKNVATAPRATGSALGTATINLNGGRLRFRDDATAGTTAVGNTAIPFGNAVTLSANSFLDAGRANTTDTISGNIVDLGRLTVTAGTKVLNVDTNIGTGAGAGAGNYITRFAFLDGPGTFIKAGAGRLEFVSVANTFSGNIGIAGPQNLTVAPTFNTTSQQNLILPAVADISTFALNGLYITEASKTLNVSGAFSVNANPGDIASNKSNNPGALAVTSSTSLNVGSLVNNGTVGAAGGAATISSSGGFSGSGHFVTNGQQLILAGSGITSGIKIAGNNIVNATAATQNLAGVQVQSGTLKLTPTAAAATSGTITVFGAPASTPTVAVPNVASVAAVNATLNLDGTAGAITHTGGITNNGTVLVSAGTTTVTGTIAGTEIGYTPGLLEGFTTVPGGALPVDVNRVANPGNFGVRLEPRMFQMNVVTQQALTGHTDNDTWIYTGYIRDDDGVFSFAENIDDRAAVWIDGVLALNANNGGTSRVVSTAYKDGQAGTGALTAGSNGGTPSQNFGAGITLPGFGDGWHLIELRFNNGTGGAGPIAGNGFGVNYGLGYKNGIGALDGADYIKPIDDGTGSLFVTPVGGKGVIQIQAGSTLNTGGFSQTSRVLLNGNGAAVNITAAGANDTDSLTLAAGVTSGSIAIPTGATVTAGTGATLSGLSVSAGGVLTRTGAGTLTVTSGSDQTIGASGLLSLNGGTTNLNGVGASSGNLEINNAGTFALLNGTLGGNATIKGGLLGGIGSLAGGITATDASGGTIAPGSSTGVSPGKLTVGTLLSNGPSILAVDLGHSTVGPVVAGVDFDQIRVTGDTLDLDGPGGGGVPTALTLQINPGLLAGDILTIILNDGTDAATGLLSFGGTPLANGATFSQQGYSFQISYFDNATTPAFETAGGDDVSILVTVPEPTSLSALAAASALAMGLQRFRRRKA